MITALWQTNKLKALGLWTGGVLFIALMVLNPRTVGGGVERGLKIAFGAVMPSTFPYIIVSSLIVSSGLGGVLGKALSFLSKAFNLPRDAVGVLPLSLICGFPVGAVMANNLYQTGLCSREEGERMAAFCNFCGPGYIFSVLGGRIMGDGMIGLVVYSVQWICAFFLAFALRGKIKTPVSQNWGESGGNDINKWGDFDFGKLLTAAIINGGRAFLNITFNIVFFSVVSSVLCRVLPFIPPYVFGILEMSTGIESLVGVSNPALRLFLGCLILYFSGISVYMQVRGALCDEISTKKYILARMIIAPVGSFLSVAVCRLTGLI